MNMAYYCKHFKILMEGAVPTCRNSATYLKLSFQNYDFFTEFRHNYTDY